MKKTIIATSLTLCATFAHSAELSISIQNLTHGIYFTPLAVVAHTPDASLFEVGESWSGNLNTYDAGTEINSEASGTIPGPADSGEGFNPTRNDSGFVSLHPGVVSNQDGLDTSVLLETHKFDNPSARVTVVRNE